MFCADFLCWCCVVVQISYVECCVVLLCYVIYRILACFLCLMPISSIFLMLGDQFLMFLLCFVPISYVLVVFRVNF